MSHRGFLSTVGVLIALALVACGDEKTPTQPTPSTFSVGGAVRQKLPDGTPGVLVAGVRVEAVRGGAVTTSTTSNDAGRYTLQNLSGTFELRFSKEGYQIETISVGPLAADLTVDALISPVGRVLVGIVTETAPTETTPIEGATVVVASGYNQGASAVTDSRGRYQLTDVSGDFEILVSRPGYDPATVRAVEGVSRLDVRLMPDGQPAHTDFGARLCGIVPDWLAGGDPSRECVPGNFPYPLQRHHWLPVHRAGTMTISVEWDYVGDYYPNYLNVEVRCGGQVVAQQQLTDLWPWPPAPPGRWRAMEELHTEPCAYEIKVFHFIPDRKGGDWTTYRMKVDHPK